MNQILDVAQQAEYQYLDVKIEPLLSIVDDLFTADKDRKLIIFTEFVATQQYLSKLPNDNGYTTSLRNGSLSIDDRNLVLAEFREKANTLISTDAGGEGLNLQFSNCIINYDLPWNPMKIEQRIGRVDRIGQQRDVEVYNFVLADTVESRVKDVLEEKLSVILKEIGIDKYVDVLDSETAGVNFTDAYMNSIRNPKSIEYNIKPIEKDLRTQFKNTLKMKDLIREEKDLTGYVGADTSFDIDDALRKMMAYYENFVGDPGLPLDTYSINDDRNVKHLRKEIRQDEHAHLLSISIKDFPNEKGWFMLWHLSVAADGSGGKTLPVFINEHGILRPMAGKKIWDAILDDGRIISVSEGTEDSSEHIAELADAARNYAYDMFNEMRSEYDRRIEENHKKYNYALSLRFEAAGRIGIENIRNHKLRFLSQEKEEREAQYCLHKQICPDFYLELLARME